MYSSRRPSRGFLAAALWCTLVLALAAPGLAQAPVELSVVFSSDLAEQVQASIDRFTAKHPHIKVNVLGFDGDRTEFIYARQVAGMPIDIIEASTTISPALIGAGIGTDLSELLDSDPDISLADFIPGAVRPFTRGESEVYALPVDLRMYVAVVNLDRVDAAGLAHPNTLAPSDWNWERFEEYLRVMTTFTPDGGVQRHGSTLRWDGLFTFTYQAGGRFVDHPTTPTRSTFTDPRVVQAFEFAERLLYPTPFVRIDGNISNHAWMQLGATTKGAADLRETGLNYDLIRWPAGPENDGMVVGSTGILLNSQSAYPEEAWALLKHLLTDEEHTLDSIRNTMRPSAYLPHLRLYSPANFPENLPPGFAMLPELVANPYLDTAPAFDGWEEIVERYRNAVRQELATGAKPALQILTELDQFASTFLPAKN